MALGLKGPAAQMVVGGGTVGLACLAITTAALRSPWTGSTMEQLWQVALSLGLAGSIILAYKFPLQVSHKATLHVTGVPMYLAVIHLPPALAGATVGLGILGGEFVARCRCSNPVSHVLTHAGRLGLTALLASVIAHAPLIVGHGALDQVPWIGAGVVLWLGDFISILVLLAPMTGQPPIRLFLSLMRSAGAQEAVQYVIGLVSALATVQYPWAFPLLVFPTALIYLTLERANQKQEDARRFLESMADAVDLRDPSTGGHSRRVTELTQRILEELGVHGPQAALIVSAARVHDIGKIGVPDSILNKPGRLSADEWAVMMSHSEQGAQLLARSRDFAGGVEIVRHHHESWDGTGYPHRLAGAGIPFGARVVAVADSFDAMTSVRPYRPGVSPQQAASILRDGSNQQWDRAIVEALLRVIGDQLEEKAYPLPKIVPPAAMREAATA